MSFFPEIPAEPSLETARQALPLLKTPSLLASKGSRAKPEIVELNPPPAMSSNGKLGPDSS
jgi:hypothetical protein